MELFIGSVLTCLLASAVLSQNAATLGYINKIMPECASVRETRHAKVEERRADTIILVHRGAWAFAPENTLEAYAAAMDYGADGCEIDIRRTADGVLVLFHDDMLDHLTDGFGQIEDYTYYELLQLDLTSIYGTATSATKIPTFAAVLELAKQRAMLLHLDIKKPGLEEQIAGMLDEADMWDHVIGVNWDNTPNMRQNPKLRLLKPKDYPGLFERRRDMDLQIVRDTLASPGEIVIVDDPRLVANELGRVPYRPIPIPTNLRMKWSSASSKTIEEAGGSAIDCLRKLSRQIDITNEAQLLSLISFRPMERVQVEGSEEYEKLRTERIVTRAWAARQLARLGVKSDKIIEALEHQVTNRSLHKNWRYHGLDGAAAVQALAKIGAMDSVPLLIEVFHRQDQMLERVRGPESKMPLAWCDFRIHGCIMKAMGELKCAESKAFLLKYLSLDEEAARKIGIQLFDVAAKSLLAHDLSQTEIEMLLKSPHSTVRGTALLECIDHPTEARLAVVKNVAPWALGLPRAVK